MLAIRQTVYRHTGTLRCETWGYKNEILLNKKKYIEKEEPKWNQSGGYKVELDKSYPARTNAEI